MIPTYIDRLLIVQLWQTLLSLDRIDENRVVKVADFGLTEDIYSTNYLHCQANNERLPIRWMAPESIERNIFNEKTDVVSFIQI